MYAKKRNLRKLDDEVWRVVPKTNKCYQISNYGRIKSFAYNKTDGKILKCSVINGFKMVQITKINGPIRLYVHKLAAQVWIPRPSDKHTFVTHLDGNLKNNQISNLEWHTRESLKEKHREMALRNEKLSNRPKVHSNSKLKESDIALLKSLLERGVVQAKIAKLFSISEMQVTRIKRGENWGHVKPITSKDI
jgi:hypothetical protein